MRTITSEPSGCWNVMVFCFQDAVAVKDTGHWDNWHCTITPHVQVDVWCKEQKVVKANILMLVWLGGVNGWTEQMNVGHRQETETHVLLTHSSTVTSSFASIWTTDINGAVAPFAGTWGGRPTYWNNLCSRVTGKTVSNICIKNRNVSGDIHNVTVSTVYTGTRDFGG